ncbi:MAG: hypothetical protein F4X66_07825 [Chloroflexi bacterium]|nr:hypothetical protein [Chloroflexota bacterium]
MYSVVMWFRSRSGGPLGNGFHRPARRRRRWLGRLRFGHGRSSVVVVMVDRVVVAADAVATAVVRASVSQLG